MPTVMRLVRSEGRARFCGERCYSAKSADCCCCCNGKNHGVGLGKALERTRNREGVIRNGVLIAYEEKKKAEQDMLF